MNFGYPIEELDDSPVETISRDGLKAVRKFLLQWRNRLDFATRMTSVNYGYATGPATYPAFTSAFVESIQFQPFSKKPDEQRIGDPTTQLNTFNQGLSCLATVSYSTRQAQTSPDPKADGLPDGTFATYRQQFSGEFMTVPSRALKWDSDSKKIGQDVRASVYIPLAEHVVTWNRVSRPPWNAISSLRGMVNDAAFRIPGCGQTREAETLLFEGGEIGTEFKLDPQQPQTWNLTYTLKERRVRSWVPNNTTVYGWNHLFRDDNGGGWDRPTTGISNAPMHAKDDFKKLFRLV